MRGIRFVLPAVFFASACVIPPRLDNEPDAAAVINTPPAISSVRGDDGAEWSLGLEVPIQRPSGPRQSVLIQTFEADTTDTHVARIFVNYRDDAAAPPDAQCTAGAGNEATQRTLSCDITGLCADRARTDVIRIDVDVYDRLPDDDAPPRYRAPAAPGFRVTRTYQGVCQ